MLGGASSYEAMRDFDSRLAEHTHIPDSRAAIFQAWSNEELLAQAHTTGEILKRFASAVIESAERPNTINCFLRELDLKAVSRDHDWRRVFADLRAFGAGREAHKLIAVRKYLQYLRSRKDLLEYIRSKRAGLEGTGEISDTLPLASDEHLWHRLPMGENVIVRLAFRADLAIRLGRHVFQIRDGYPPGLIDPDGRVAYFRRGQQCAGRHPEIDLVLDRGYSDVSRAHLLINWSGGEHVQLTDLSSRGTYLRASGAVHVNS